MQAILALAILSAFSATAHAQAGSCAELAVQRNAIYKRAGYCFKTAAMIRVFGNAGCMYDDERDVPLSEEGRQEVAAIVRMEREMGCR